MRGDAGQAAAGLAACQKHPRVAPAAGWWHVRARAARQVAPRSRKDLRSTWHSASGKHKHASECGSVRGSVEGAARGGRASREGGLITSQTRAEPSGIDRVAAKERVTRGWSSSHPAHARVPHRIHGRHRGSNMPMSRQDLTLVRTAQSHRLLVTCPEGGATAAVGHASTIEVHRGRRPPIGHGRAHRAWAQPPGPPCARELRRQPRRTESQSRAAGGFARALARWAPCERL